VDSKNTIGLKGIEFVEFSSANPKALENLFIEFGFSKTEQSADGRVDHFAQNRIHFLLNTRPASYARMFAEAHGPCVSSMGWLFEDPETAYRLALSRGAKPAARKDYFFTQGEAVPAIEGIGGSLIYFLAEDQNLYAKLGFQKHSAAVQVKSKGFEYIDHLTNNVHQGTMKTWSDFYKNVFEFTEVRYFDIRGAKTGLTSYALKSPGGEFCIPINEGTEAKSQINEYLDEYKGPGVQHIAFCSSDIVESLNALKSTSIQTLDIDDEYYAEVFDRVPNVTEDKKTLQKLGILVDGDEEGYLLQIFTRNIIGPIFIEVIQRKNHYSFGEGNFGALFRSIERDQQRRGFL
jgi:4-hydroxyphenylpyruvate dioxygenase